MRKTTVYLDDAEVEALRRAAATSGKSQSELIREGIRLVAAQVPKRTFHSMGKGDGPPYAPIDPDEFYEWVMGNRTRAVSRREPVDGADPGR